MSGWVDSAVTAYLLLQQWYDVIAWFMKNYADESNPNCHTREDRDMAIKVCQHLGVTTFVIVDFREQYDRIIVDYIYEWYKAGYTPNPDILCNSEVKFKLFLQEAMKLGCDFVATGHYARITQDTNGYHLLKGVDTNKDQSYFLGWLNQEQLSKSLFPIGELTKPEVRKIAHLIGLPNADRKDSQWICFIGKVPMKEFLKQTLPVKPGPIIDTEGNILGEHEWAWFYTIGQRQGLGLAGWPWFVIEKEVKTNTVTVGKEDEQRLYNDQLTTATRHRIGKPRSFPFEAQAKIRYRQDDQAVTVSNEEQSQKQHVTVTFWQPQRAISSWQTVVLYDDDELIASGIIA